MSIILISAPVFAYVTNSSQCDNDVLSTYSGSANLTANWQGNPISVTWYNGDTQYASNSCTYGGNLTMPSNIPTREGYTFKGWRARDLTCGLRHEDTSVAPTTMAWKDATGSCVYYNADTDDYSESCSDTHVTGFNNGEWEVGYSFGRVRGSSICSGREVPNEGDNGWIGDSMNWTATTESELTSASGEKKNVWCKATSYIPNGENQCDLTASKWVYAGWVYTASECLSMAAVQCAQLLYMYEPYRGVFYGQLQ